MIKKMNLKDWQIEYETDSSLSKMGCLKRYVTFRRGNEAQEIVIYTNSVKRSIEMILAKAKEIKDILKYDGSILF
jgi:hypothetical protein